MQELRLNIPISKIDEEQRMVWGIATTEDIDSQGDIVDYAASKIAFGDWLGNIREMHNPVAVGKAVDIQYDDVAKQVMIGAKISESADGENAWTKVKEGILQGFSIGGKVNKIERETMMKDDEEVIVNRLVDYELSETSLVDNPANPKARLVMVKSVDGDLYRTEVPERVANPFPITWWQKMFMLPLQDEIKKSGSSKAELVIDMVKAKKSKSKGVEMKKNMYDAAWLLDLACQLASYINMEAYEGESVDDLKAALESIKAAIVDEITEPTEILTVAVELASKVTNMKKGKVMAKDIKKVAPPVGGEERDEKAETVTPAEGETATESTEDKKVEETNDDEKVEAGAEDADKTDSEGESSETDKSVSVPMAKFNALEKQVQTLAQSSDIAKSITELKDEVVGKLSSLEGRLDKVEKASAPTKVKASYVVTKGEEGDESSETDDLVKRAEEIQNNPQSAKPGEAMDIATELHKRNNLKLK